MDSTSDVASNRNKRKYEIDDDANDSSVNSSSSNNAINLNIDESTQTAHPIEPNAIDANALLAPPGQDSPSHILKAFNEHCSYEVFKWLHYIDLTNAAKVCVKFQRHAQEVFSTKYKRLGLSHTECNYDQMESVLCEFGSFIQSLRIDSYFHAADGNLFRTIIQNCTPDLKVLKLIRMKIQIDSPDVHLPFPKLQELELNECEGNISLAHVNDDCPQLAKVSLSCGYLKGVNVDRFINRKFKKLEQLLLHVCGGNISDGALENFITLNPTLNELNIRGYVHLQTSHPIRLIGQNMLALKTLSLGVSINGLEHFQNDVQLIGNIRSLKSLCLNFNEQKVTPLASVLVANNVPIENLEMNSVLVDDIANNWVSQLKQIKTLDMDEVWGMNDENMIHLARNLPELQKFCLCASDGVFTIDGIIRMMHFAKKLSTFSLKLFGDSEMTVNLGDYNNMLDTIRNWPDKICPEIGFFGVKINVPENILRENRVIFDATLVHEFLPIFFVKCGKNVHSDTRSIV